MSRIMILTDSCCDLPLETINELGIKVLPFTLTVNGQSFREIGEVMGKTENWARVTFFRARTNLKRQLEMDET